MQAGNRSHRAPRSRGGGVYAVRVRPAQARGGPGQDGAAGLGRGEPGRPGLAPEQAAQEPKGKAHQFVERVGDHDGEDGNQRQDGVEQRRYSGRREYGGPPPPPAPRGAPNAAAV